MKTNRSNKVEIMIKTNIKQKEYYEKATGENISDENGMATNLWRKLRKRAFSVFDPEEFAGRISKLHLDWAGDISQLKVLDLGVGDGNPLSMHLAQNAQTYVAIDLSKKRIDGWQAVVERHGVRDARFYEGDFLDRKFDESDFDLVYAMAVFHHFHHLESFLDVLENKLAPQGRVITFDPVQVWLPVRFLRAVYRPFQTDSDWEHPFDKKSLDIIEKRFDVLDKRGLQGLSKWASVVGLFLPAVGQGLAKKWNEYDLKNMSTSAKVRRCLQVTYHIKRKKSA